MRTRLTALLAATLCVHVLTAAASSLTVDEWRKIDPMLHALLHAERDSRLDRAQLLKGMTQNGRMPVIVKTAGDPRSLQRYGVRINSIIGNIATLEIEPHHLSALASAPELIYLEGPRRLEPLAPSLDISVPAIGADQLHLADPALTGENAVIGFIDTGLDLDHPGFKTETGDTRVLAAWDQINTRLGRIPEGFTYGAEWTQADINAGAADLTDRSGHGTSVAGIAAGNGRVDDGETPEGNSSPRYAGVAPKAGIIAVRTSYFSAHFLDAVNFILGKAQQLNMPCVLNLSFGYLGGPHDGRGSMQEALQTLARERPGRIIVAAAGNSGDDNAHALIELKEGDPPKRLYVQPYFGVDRFFVDAWTSSNDNISAQMFFPTNDGDHDPFGFEVAEPDENHVFFVPGGRAQNLLVNFIYAAPSASYNDLNNMYILFRQFGNLGVPISQHPYVIELQGEGVMHAYAGRARFLHVPNDPQSVVPDGNYSVAGPADADEIIAVGSVSTRNIWQTLEGFYVRTSFPEDYGTRSYFSSIGPRTDGGEKPDIMAPGRIILAPFSQHAVDNIAPFRQTPDGRNQIIAGTSLSAAHVSGLAALLLQKNPATTQIEALERARDAGRDPAWSPEYGNGIIDAYQFLDVPRPPTGIAAEVDGSSAALTWQPNEESGLTYRIEADGETVGTVSEPPYQIEDLDDNARVYRVRAVNGSGQASPPSQAVSLTEGGVAAGPIREIEVTNLNEGVELNWDLVEGAAAYSIIWGNDPENLENNLSTPNNWLILEAMENGVDYYFAVAPIFVDGLVGVYSAPALARPRPTPILSQSGLAAREGFPFETEDDLITSPAAVDIDGDGRLEIFIGGYDRNVYGFDANGNMLPGWPQTVGAPIVGSVAVGDMDRDGTMEIVAAADRKVHVWSPNGTPRPGFPAETSSAIRSNPTLVSIDSDPGLEILVASSDEAPGVYAFGADGDMLQGFPIELEVEEYVYTAPIAGDINLDGKIEIYQTSFGGPVWSWDENLELRDGYPFEYESGSSPQAAPMLAMLDDKDLSLLFSFLYNGSFGGISAMSAVSQIENGFPAPVVNRINAPVSVGDIDGDGQAEIAAVDTDSYLYVWNPDGTEMEPFPIPLSSSSQSTPLLADLDGDGASEIIAVGNYGRNYGCVIYFIESDGSVFDFVTLPVSVFGSPTLADLDGDGTAELIVPSLRQEADPDDPIAFPEIGGRLFVWDTPYTIHRADWTTDLADPLRSGVAPFQLPAASVIEDLTIRWTIDGELIAKWTSTQERGNIGWRLLRSESPDGPFAPVSDKMRVSFRPNSNDPISYQATDPTAEPQKTYYYRLENIGTMNRSSMSETIEAQSTGAQDLLTQWGKVKVLESFPIFPNPSNPEAWIPFALGMESDLSVRIYDSRGRLVRTLDMGRLPAGVYKTKNRAARWDGKNDLGELAASGLYFVEIAAGSRRTPLRRLLILK